MNETLLLWLLALAELLQIGLVVAFFRQRYGKPLAQLKRVSSQLADGVWPKSYFIDGHPVVEQVSRDLEKLGASLEARERQQREEDSNLDVLLANMVEGVMVVDERRIVRIANRELLRLFDLRQSPLGRTVLESLREAPLEVLVRETIQRGEPRQQELVLDQAGLPSRHFEVSAVPIRTKTDQVGGAVVVFHDISRIKQLEVVRQEFVANVSHELRTPLAIFRGYVETLEDNPGLPRDEVRRVLETMRRHSNRLNALVEDLLALTRLESRQARPEFSILRVEAFLKQLVRDWGKRPQGSEAEIIVDVQADLPVLEADEQRLEQVLFNLLENAVAYSNAPRRITLSARAEGELMAIRVADNGVGIPPTDLPHIFERFYRVDRGRSRSSGGTGLGLSIVKHIVQLHDGTVEAESEVGTGTTIVIRLPPRQQQPGAVTGL